MDIVAHRTSVVITASELFVIGFHHLHIRRVVRFEREAWAVDRVMADDEFSVFIRSKYWREKESIGACDSSLNIERI